MSNERLRELISAYVDDELTADERMRAEQLLASDDALRQYRDELLQLRGALAQLPKYQLPAEFAAGVLQQAERTLLTTQRPDAPPAGRPFVARKTLPSWLSTGKGRAVAALAGAACLIVLVLVTLPLLQHNAREPRLAENSKQTPAAAEPLTPSPQLAPSASDTAAPNASQPDEQIAQSDAAEQAESSERSESPASPAGADSVAQAMPRDASPDETAAMRDGMPIYLLIIEVVLSPRGVEQQAFLEALALADIPTLNTVAVDRQLEDALLANRMFGGVTSDQLPESAFDDEANEQVKDFLQLYFVVAHGQHIADVEMELRERQLSGEVVSVTLDVAVGSSESDLAVQLNRLVTPDVPADPQLVRAHRLTLESEVRDRLLEALNVGNAKLRDERQQAEEALGDDEAAANVNPNLGPGGGAPELEMLRLMNEQQFPVLFVLRSAEQVRSSQP